MSSRRPPRPPEPRADRSPPPAGALSANGHWLFGGLFAVLVLAGFAFGVMTGAARPKVVEVAEAKKEPEKPAEKPSPAPPAKPPVEAKPKEAEPKPREKEPEPKKPEPEPEPKPKEPEPKKPEPEPKKPEPKKVEPKAKAVAFAEVAVVFRTYCNNCHGAAGKPQAGVDLRTAAAILKGNENGALVKPGDPKNSVLYQSVEPPSGTMPPDGKPRPSEKELKLIHDWIAGGAKPRRTVRRRR